MRPNLPALRLLFVSNLFPDQAEPYRGLDNACLLHELSARWEIEAIAIRPELPFRGRTRKPREIDERFSPEYVSAKYVPKIGSYFNVGFYAAALRKAIAPRLGEFDVLLGSWMFPDVAALAQLAREMKFPLVAIAQGSDLHQYLKDPVRRSAILAATATTRSIVTRSGDLAGMLAAAGCPREKIHPIYNGVDPALFHPGDPKGARAENELPPGAPVILFVGNFYPVKNPLLAIEAHRRLLASHPDAILVMAGGGPMEAEARHLAHPQVRFAGRRNAAEIASLMRAADLLCVPSHYEGVPNVILESLTSGLRVVATRVGGIPEILTEPNLGALVEPANPEALAAALGAQLATPADRAAIVSYSERFRWPVTAAAYETLLLAACEPR